MIGYFEAMNNSGNLVVLNFICILENTRSFKGGGCLFPCLVRSMGSWNKLWKGFVTNERPSGTLVDVAVWHFFESLPDQFYSKVTLNNRAVFGVIKLNKAMLFANVFAIMSVLSG